MAIVLRSYSQTLADYLGLTPSTEPTQQQVPAVDDYTKLSGEEFAKRIVGSAEFRTYLLNGVTLGTLPKEVIVRLLDHAWGKPIEVLKVDQRTTTTHEGQKLTAAELAERARRLVDLMNLVQPPAA